MAKWKNNKLIGVLAGIIFLASMGPLVFFTLQKNIAERKEYEIGFKEWKSRHIFDGQGHAIAEIKPAPATSAGTTPPKQR